MGESIANQIKKAFNGMELNNLRKLINERKNIKTGKADLAAAMQELNTKEEEVDQEIVVCARRELSFSKRTQIVNIIEAIDYFPEFDLEKLKQVQISKEITADEVCELLDIIDTALSIEVSKKNKVIKAVVDTIFNIFNTD